VIGKERSGEEQLSELFVGRISPFLLFEMEYHSLFHLVESHKSDCLFQKPNPATEACLISLLAHFEAFCKHQFAAIINIFPELLRTFCSRRRQASIKLSDVISLYGTFDRNIGFVISEQYDFGSGELINGLFRDLLRVTPFSKDESEHYNSILLKRHLLVHHAGIYTLQYLKENSLPDDIRSKAFQDSILIDTEDYHVISDFLFNMNTKITRVTTRALTDQLEKGPGLTDVNIRAIEQLLSGLYDPLDWNDYERNRS
jgi:hypothetical protein